MIESRGEQSKFKEMKWNRRGCARLCEKWFLRMDTTYTILPRFYVNPKSSFRSVLSNKCLNTGKEFNHKKMKDSNKEVQTQAMATIKQLPSPP